MPAPGADLADGLLDVVIFGDIDFKTARRNLPALRRGEHLSLKEVTTFRCRELRIRGAAEMIDLDGEFVGRHPLRFAVVPNAVSILAEEEIAPGRCELPSRGLSSASSADPEPRLTGPRPHRGPDWPRDHGAANAIQRRGRILTFLTGPLP